MTEAEDLQGLLSWAAGAWAALPPRERERLLEWTRSLASSVGAELPPDVAQRLQGDGQGLAELLSLLPPLDRAALEHLAAAGLADPQVRATLADPQVRQALAALNLTAPGTGAPPVS